MKLENYSVNGTAIALAEKLLIPNQDALRIQYFRQENGVHIFDMGVRATGSWLAGKYYTDILLGGLGKTRLTTQKIGDVLMPAVAVYVDHPDVAELASHMTFCRFDHDGVRKAFSGPVRCKRPDQFSSTVAYKDKTDKVIASFQSDVLPDESLTAHLAEEAGVRPENLYILVAATGTLVGSLQVCARNVEQVCPTLVVNGFDVSKVKYACGVTPVVGVVRDENTAYGWVNDCLIYGQETILRVDCEDEEITSILPTITMDQERNSDVYGVPFKEIFAMCGNAWTNVPRHWDAPNKIVFFNMRTGHLFSVGTTCEEVLLKDFYGENGGRIAC